MHVPSCFPVKENTWGVGFRLRRPPAKQQGSGSQRQPSPALPDCERGAGCENGLRSFPEFWPVGAGVCSPMSVPLPLQTAAPRSSVGAIGETGLRAVWPSLARVALLGPGRRRSSHAQSCFPTKENPWGVGFGHPRPPAKQQGPGSLGSPAPVRLMESGLPGVKTACVAFSIRGALGLWFAARVEFPFAECSCQ